MLHRPAPCRCALTTCCAALAQRPDLAASAALWGQLQLEGLQAWPAWRRSSLAAWLAARRDGLRALVLVLDPEQQVELSEVLESLAGSGLTRLQLPNHRALPEEELEGRWGALSRLPRLRALDLSSCDLPCVPPELTALAGTLSNLSLANNLLLGPWTDAGTFTPLRELRELTRLRLSGCNLRRVPREVSALTNLSELLLGRNALLGAGAARGALAPLAELRRLTLLTLCWGSLSAVPPEVGCLTTLRALVSTCLLILCACEAALSVRWACRWLRRQGQARRARKVWKARQLQALLAGCWPQDLSRNIALGQAGAAALEPLERLWLELTSLDLSYCCLEAVPSQLLSLRALRTLSLSANLALGGGSDTFSRLEQLPALSRLDLTNCNCPAGAFALLGGLAQRGVCVRF